MHDSLKTKKSHGNSAVPEGNNQNVNYQPHNNSRIRKILLQLAYMGLSNHHTCLLISKLQVTGVRYLDITKGSDHFIAV
jgi:hypothetical protein